MILINISIWECKMRLFNKKTAMSKINNKNNIKTKRNTIIISVVALLTILYFSFVSFESSHTYSLISGNVYIKGKLQ